MKSTVHLGARNAFTSAVAIFDADVRWIAVDPHHSSGMEDFSPQTFSEIAIVNEKRTVRCVFTSPESFEGAHRHNGEMRRHLRRASMIIVVQAVAMLAAATWLLLR